MNNISTPADYGNIIVNPEFNAFQRGSGQYNPPPLFEQTTDRGKAYTQALNHYEDNYYSFTTNGRGSEESGGKVSNEEYSINPKEYSVGVSGLYSQDQSWKRPDLEGVGNQYVDWAMKSVHENPSVLLNFYFSVDNVEYLQKRMVDDIKEIKGVDISTQSKDELLIIMRNNYQRALNGWLPHTGDKDGVYPRGETPCSLETRLSRLNKATLEETEKQIISGIDMYQNYYKDASSLPMPLERSTYTSAKGSRILSENVGFNSGHSFTNAINSYNQRDNIL